VLTCQRARNTQSSGCLKQAHSDLRLLPSLRREGEVFQASSIIARVAHCDPVTAATSPRELLPSQTKGEPKGARVDDEIRSRIWRLVFPRAEESQVRGEEGRGFEK